MRVSKNRVRTQDHGALEPLRANIYYAPSYMTVYAQYVLLYHSLKVIIFTSNVLAVQTGQSPPPADIFTAMEP
jgi:hypothetical protein